MDPERNDASPIRYNEADEDPKGQGPGETELGLSHFCDSSSIDIIPLGFMNRYLAQANGWPGTNFGGSCWAQNYTAPGYNGVNDPTQNDLKKKCPTMVSGIPYCQSLGKKILLSLGGQVFAENSYALTSVKDAEYMADFLWGAFGPLDSTATWPRPFDTDAAVNEVDGFDFDIEHVNSGEQAFYIILINRLRSYFATADKQYIITGAPQCSFPDEQMGDIITQVQFDMLFIQYYDTSTCSAREWLSNNPGYGISTNVEQTSGFKENLDALIRSLPASKSKDVKLYIGLLGSKSAGVSGDYLEPALEVAPLIKAHFCNSYFGGIMIYDAGHSEQNIGNDGKPFHDEIKDILIADSTDTKQFTCATTGTPTTTQASSPTSAIRSASKSERVTTITMTLCPSSPVAFSTSIIYTNSTARPLSNYTLATYLKSSSRSTVLSPATVTSTTTSLLLSATSSSTAVTARNATSISTITSCAAIFGNCVKKTTTVVTESHVLYNTRLVHRVSSPAPAYALNSSSSSSAFSSLASSNKTSSRASSAATTPTYSVNLNSKASSTTSGNECFVVVVTMNVPVTSASCTSTPIVTSKPATLARTSGSSPLSIGSSLFFVFSVGVPGTFGVFWYILGRVLL